MRDFPCTQQISKATRLRNLGQRGRNMLAKAGESDRAIRVKMVRFFVTFENFVVPSSRPILGWTPGVCALDIFLFVSSQSRA